MSNLNVINHYPVGVTHTSAKGSEIGLTDVADENVVVVTVKNRDWKASAQMAYYSNNGVVVQKMRGAKADFSFGDWTSVGSGSAPDLSGYVQKTVYEQKIASLESRITALESKPAA